MIDAIVSSTRYSTVVQSQPFDAQRQATCAGGNTITNYRIERHTNDYCKMYRSSRSYDSGRAPLPHWLAATRSVGEKGESSSFDSSFLKHGNVQLIPVSTGSMVMN